MVIFLEHDCACLENKGIITYYVAQSLDFKELREKLQLAAFGSSLIIMAITQLTHMSPEAQNETP